MHIHYVICSAHARDRHMAEIHACGCLQAMLLTSFLKLVLASPNDVQLRVAVENILERYSRWVPPL